MHCFQSGLAGMVAKKLGFRVTLTDQKDTISIARKNLERNGMDNDSEIDVKELNCKNGPNDNEK